MAILRGNKWQANAYLDGKRVRPTFNTKEEAEAYERNPSLHIGVTVGELFRHGYDYLWAGKNNASDTHRITEELISLLGFNTPLASVNGAKVQDLVMRWRHKGNSGATINRKVSALRMLLKHAQERGVINSIPAMPKHQHEGEGRERFLTNDEAINLIGMLSPDHAKFAMFLLYTGARVGEALELRWDDISPGQVTFRWQTTKNKRTRVIGLNAHAQAALDRSQPTPWGHINYDNFVRDFRKAKNKVGLGKDDEVVPHILRHTHASWLVQHGVPIQAVSKLLGHSSLMVTMRYAKLAPDNLLKVSAVLVSGDCAK